MQIGVSTVAAFRTAVLTCAAFFAAGLMIAVLGPSLPMLAARLEIDIAALGGLFSTFSVGVMLAQVVCVWASGRFGQRATLAASMLLMGAGGVALTQSGNLLGILGAALVSGVGFGGVLAIGNTLIARLFAARSAAALNGINLFFGVGSIVGPALAAAANTRFGTPQAALWVGAGGLIALAPLVLVAAAQPNALASSIGSARAKASGRGWLFGLLLLAYTGIEIGFSAWLTLYMISSAAMPQAQAILVVSGFWFALTTGRGLAAAFGSRLSPPHLLMLCLLGLLCGALLLAFSIGQVWLTIAAVLVFGLSCGPVFPTVIAILTASDPTGAATSRALLLGNGGGLIVPALIGLLLTHSGPLAVAVLLIAVALLLLLIGIATQRTEAPPEREQAATDPAQPGVCL